MEDAIANLTVGQISDAVETDAGTHFILLKQRSAPAQPDDEVLRAEIIASLQQAESERALLLVVDELRDAVFSLPTLAEAAQQLNLEPATSNYFSESAGEGLFAETSLRQAAFSPDVLEDRTKSEVIELSGSRCGARQINDYRPAEPSPWSMYGQRLRRSCVRLQSEKHSRVLELW